MAAVTAVPARRAAPASFAPTTLAEALEFVRLIANSSFVPPDYRGKPGDILIAIQMGAELGIQPIQALQGIAVIRQKPTVWGDTALALIEASGLMEDFEEKILEAPGEARAGVCKVKRKGRPTPTVKTFTVKDAMRAKLWGKAGPWTDYPDRMLQMRARGFALRDTFSDVLKGLWLREEAQDISDEPLPKAESDLPWVEEVAEPNLIPALEASLEKAAQASPPPDSGVSAPASIPSLEPSVVEGGGGLSPFGDLDEPVLINEQDRKRFHACRDEGGHGLEETKAWLERVYGITSTKQIHRDWLDVICTRLINREKL